MFLIPSLVSRVQPKNIGPDGQTPTQHTGIVFCCQTSFAEDSTGLANIDVLTRSPNKTTLLAIASGMEPRFQPHTSCDILSSWHAAHALFLTAAFAAAYTVYNGVVIHA